MNNNIIIILLIVLLIFLYFNMIKERFTEPANTSASTSSEETCNFNPEQTSTWGNKKLDSLGDELVLKSRDECILTCSELSGCDK